MTRSLLVEPAEEDLTPPRARTDVFLGGSLIALVLVLVFAVNKPMLTGDDEVEPATIPAPTAQQHAQELGEEAVTVAAYADDAVTVEHLEHVALRQTALDITAISAETDGTTGLFSVALADGTTLCLTIDNKVGGNVIAADGTCPDPPTSPLSTTTAPAAAN